MTVKIEATAACQWYALIKETQTQAGVYFDDQIESYLILTLDAYTKDKSFIDTCIAKEYLRSVKRTSSSANRKLRLVGDHCLILAGLFPERAEKLNLSADYYTDIGQQAYLTLSERMTLKLNPTLFYYLAMRFGEIKQVLNAVREIANNRIIN